MTMDMANIFQPALELIDSGVLLRGTAPGVASRWHIVRDREEAQALAWSANDSVEATWNDLREQQTANIVFEREGKVWDYWEMTLSPRFDAYLSERGWGDLYDDVVGDLYYICCNKHFCSGQRLWDEMLEAYRAGGWPCGWLDGEYPEGRLAAYMPSSREPDSDA